MTVLAEYHYLCLRVGVILFLDASLQLKHHRTRRVNYLDIVASCRLICLGRLTVRPEQHLDIVQLLQLLMVDGYQSARMKAFHLLSVVHYITQTIKCIAFRQLLLSLLYSGSDTKTKTA